jgi:predicted metal-dependent enzyme (double-stranded beta helix superfamily)
MAGESYTLEQFIADVDGIARAETSGAAITERVAPLLGRLVKNRDAIPARYRTKPAGGRGRYMLHRAPHFNVTAVVWGPGDTAAAHNHETWGVIGLIDNEIEETRYTMAPDASGKAGVTVTGVFRHRAGAVSRLIPEHDEIHAMHNPTARDTVEIHVYGKDLVNLERRTWSADGTEQRLVSPKYLNC